MDRVTKIFQRTKETLPFSRRPDVGKWNEMISRKVFFFYILVGFEGHLYSLEGTVYVVTIIPFSIITFRKTSYMDYADPDEHQLFGP